MMINTLEAALFHIMTYDWKQFLKVRYDIKEQNSQAQRETEVTKVTEIKEEAKGEDTKDKSNQL